MSYCTPWGQAVTAEDSAKGRSRTCPTGLPKRLMQVNILWSSDSGTAADIGTTDSLREYIASEISHGIAFLANPQLADNAIPVFRGSDNQTRTADVERRRSRLLYQRTIGHGRHWASNCPTPRLPDPGVFKIAKGQF
jgi:hypothetical protein